MGLLDTSMVNAAIPLISLYIYASSSLRKYVCIYYDCNIDDILWGREKYRQSQLFKNGKEMKRDSALYSVKGKGWRKK